MVPPGLPAPPEPAVDLVVDTSVLISVLLLDWPWLLTETTGHRAWIPPEVDAEVKYPHQRDLTDKWLAQGILTVQPIVEMESLRIFARLTKRLGRGEAACLALAAAHPEYILATDDRDARLMAEITALQIHKRLIGTIGLLRNAIRWGTLPEDQADYALRRLRKMGRYLP
jgi:predicted nucleic acid-binding protein